DVGSTSRLIIRSTVDLPQPDGPIRTTTSPAATVRSSFSTATVPSGYCLPRPSRVIDSEVTEGSCRASWSVPVAGSGLAALVSTYVPPGDRRRPSREPVVLRPVPPGQRGGRAGCAARARGADGAGRSHRRGDRRAAGGRRVLVPVAHRPDSCTHRGALH